ncbi:MAG: sulfatase-like hydrolase/transferase [Pseudomonadota bacterium]
MTSRNKNAMQSLPCFAIGLLMTLSACSTAPKIEEPTEPKVSTAPNFLLIIGDDMGKETLSCFGVGESAAKTPNLDRLCNAGVRFEAMWTQPFCSPTRATLLTGEYGFSNELYAPVLPNTPSSINQPDRPSDAPPELRILKIEDLRKVIPERVINNARGLKEDQLTLPEILRSSTRDYATGAFGKWHVADRFNGGVDHPNIAGFDHFSGIIEGTMQSHFAWKHVENGVETPATGYFSSRLIDDAIGWIETQEKPWFAWVAFTAPHEPFHKPPSSLLSADTDQLDPNGVEADPAPYFRAAIEAMDAEIGRLLMSIPEEHRSNTYIVFIGDNGSPKEVISPPYGPSRAKATFHQGGIDMPFIISGPGIEPGTYPHLANSTDIFQSVLDLADIDWTGADNSSAGIHSTSFVGALINKSVEAPRDWAYADGAMIPNAPRDQSIRDDRYKLMVLAQGRMFFDLELDPFEQNNLLTGLMTAEQEMAYDKLLAQLNELAAAPPPVTIEVFDEASVFPGYLLWHQADEIANDVINDTHLISPTGEVVHTWPANLTGGGTPGYLLPDGQIVRTGIRNRMATRRGPVASADVLQIVDKNGTVVWEVTSADLGGAFFHHDLEPMPNGNILASTYHALTGAEALAKGWDVSDARTVWVDGVVEIKPDLVSGEFEAVWAWRFDDHLIQDKFPEAENYGVVADHPGRIDPNFPDNYAPRNSFRQHINSIDYNEELNQILLSSFIYNEIWIIERTASTEEAAGAAGDLLFRYGNPAAHRAGTTEDRIFLKQHDANWIAEGLPGEGNILVHNNNTVFSPNFNPFDDEDGARAQAELEGVSEIHELFLPTSELGAYIRDNDGTYSVETAWLWSSPDYFASFQGGARRLPGGSTLLTSSADNYAIEVSEAGEIVARFDAASPSYKAFKYSEEEVSALVQK